VTRTTIDPSDGDPTRWHPEWLPRPDGFQAVLASSVWVTHSRLRPTVLGQFSRLAGLQLAFPELLSYFNRSLIRDGVLRPGPVLSRPKAA
jgi:hypothetical protein